MIAVIKSVILKAIREPNYLVFLMFFPIFLILLIGGVLGNYFEKNTLKLDARTIYYLDENKENNLIKILETEVKKINKEFSLESINTKEDGISKVKNDGDIFLNFNKDKLYIYVSNGNQLYYSYLSSIIKGIDSTINSTKILYSINPKEAENIVKEEKVSPKVELLSREKAPTSFDYYAVAEITMMTLYIMLLPFGKLYGDKKRKLYERMKLMGVSDGQYYIGSVIGYFLLSFLVTAPGFLFSKYILKTNWGDNPIIIYGAIQVLSLSSIMVGIVLAKYVKNEEKAMLVVQSIIFPVLSFLGGSYISLADDVGGAFQMITNLSPIRWINRGIFRSIFVGDSSFLLKATLLNIGIICVSLVFIFITYKRKEDRI